MATIDSVMPGTGGGGGITGETFAMWGARVGLAADASPLDDSDADGLSNAVEFYFDTSPNTANALPLTITSSSDQITVSYPVGKERVGVEVSLEGSTDLATWSAVALADDAITVAAGEIVDQAEVTLPASTTSFLRLSVAINP